MSTPDEQEKKRVWLRWFNRGGGPGSYVSVYDDMSPEDRDFLLARAKFSPSELAVVGGVRDADNWFVLTTRRLVTSQRAARLSIDIGQIAHVDPNPLAWSSHEKKGKIDQLHISDFDGRTLTIELEAQRSCLALMGVLGKIAGKNKRTDST